jgi:hypothetical protein
MADTSQWTLQQFADAAGQRAEPYPLEDAPTSPPAHVCHSCGAPLHGARNPHTNMLRVYCDRRCQAVATRRWNTRHDATPSLALTQYSWAEW